MHVNQNGLFDYTPLTTLGKREHTMYLNCSTISVINSAVFPCFQVSATWDRPTLSHTQTLSVGVLIRYG